VTLHFYLLNKAAIQVAVVQLVEALRYIPEDRVFDFNGVREFSIDLILLAALWSWVRLSLYQK